MNLGKSNGHEPRTIGRKRVSRSDSLSSYAVTLPHSKELLFQGREVIFSQGDEANALFSILDGDVKLMATACNGKKAVLRIMGAGEFFGEECLTSGHFRIATAVALDPSIILRMPRKDVVCAIRRDPAFAIEFMTHLLKRIEMAEEELTDQILSSSENRLARVLLTMSGVNDRSTRTIELPPIDQNTLAEMVGTTRSRVSFFMNRFRRLGLIDYNGSLSIYPALREFVNRE